MDLQDLNALGFSGRTLNIEERAGLEVAIAKRRLEDGLQDLGFWGKVYGDEDDYLVVVGYGPSEDYPAKRFFYTYVRICFHRRVCNMQATFACASRGFIKMTSWSMARAGLGLHAFPPQFLHLYVHSSFFALHVLMWTAARRSRYC